jgi:hypothetical protein
MTKLRIPDSALQVKKTVWVKCPKCGERFRPQQIDLDKELGLGTAPDSRGPAPKKREAVNSILNRINMTNMRSRSAEDSAAILDALPVLPEDPPRTKIFLGVTIALVVLLLGALGWVFNASVAPTAEPQPIVATAPLDYGKDVLLYDFQALRRDLLRLRHVDRDINYKGRESRIFKYYVPLLAPDLCQEITQIHLWSSRTQEGFKMEGACADPRANPAVLEVRWDLQSANISVKDRPTEITLSLPRPMD